MVASLQKAEGGKGSLIGKLMVVYFFLLTF